MLISKAVRSVERNRLTWLLVATALSLSALDYSGFGPIRSVRETMLNVASPVQRVLKQVVSPAENLWQATFDYDELEAENLELRKQLHQSRATAAGMTDSAEELRLLLQANEIDYLPSAPKVAAKTLSFRSNELEHVIQIDKGSNAGIEVGMPVVTSLGLVGIVELVAGDSSAVRLVIDRKSVVGVRSANGLGVARGFDDHLRIDLSPQLEQALEQNKLQQGERVYTAGVPGSKLPPGIPIGALKIGDGTASIEMFNEEPDLVYVSVLLLEPSQ